MLPFSRPVHLAIGATVFALLVVAPTALGASRSISSSGPLSRIAIGDDLWCQVERAPGSVPQFYSTTVSHDPGGCGTLLVQGSTLYSPVGLPGSSAPSNPGDAYTPFTKQSQSAVTGSGTSGDPYRVITVVKAGANLTLTQTDTYVAGEDEYHSSVAIANGAGTQADVILYRAADCYFGGDDRSYGSFDPFTGGIYCAANANNRPEGLLVGIVPAQLTSAHYEGQYAPIWRQPVARAGYSTTCDCTSLVDSGVGLDWAISIPAGQTVTRAVTIRFQPDVYSPIVTLTSPPAFTRAAAPSFDGIAGTAAGDEATVIVNVYAGGTATGSPVAWFSATPGADGAYSVAATPALADGTYTAQAEQVDDDDNVGLSDARTFVLDTVAPVVALSSPATRALLIQGSTRTAAFACEDGLSGLATCTGTVAAGARLDTATLGAKSFTATATDKAGNTASVTHAYAVIAKVGALGLPTTRKCVSRRHFRLHLRAPRGARFTRVKLYVNNKRKANVKHVSTTATIDLRGLPKGRFKVKLVATLTDGRTVTLRRTYRTCASSGRASVALR